MNRSIFLFVLVLAGVLTVSSLAAGPPAPPSGRPTAPAAVQPPAAALPAAGGGPGTSAGPAAPSAPAAGSRTAQAEEKVRQGVALRDAGRLDEALRLFVQAISLDPNLAGAHCGAGQIYQKRGAPKPAADQFQAAVRVDPRQWRARASLVQIYQALGNPKARDAERAALLDLRRKGEAPDLAQAERYCCDRFTAGRRKVIVYEYFDLNGKRPVRYAFYVMDERGAKTDYRLTLGSYEELNAIAHEQHEVKPGERLFHLDGYFAGGVYRPFRQYKGEPTYDEVRNVCLQIATGKIATGEGVTPKKDGTTIGFDPASGAMGLMALLIAAGDAADGKDACPVAAEPDRESLMGF